MIEYLAAGLIGWWLLSNKKPRVRHSNSPARQQPAHSHTPAASLKPQYKPSGKIKERKAMQLTLTDEFKEAYTLLNETRQSLFITGKAGTGKSTFLEYFRNNTKKNVVVVAPTGVAAINVQGQTIHSFFKFKPGFMEPGKPKYARADLRKLYQAIDVLVIDEISMVRADLFDAMDHFLRLNAKRKGEPFGGCQVCIIGDLYQLPPVITQEDSEVYNRYYKSPYFFDAAAFSAVDFKLMELTHIFRQSDREFIDFLNHMREGTVTTDRISWFNQQTVSGSADEDHAIVLATTNRIADYTNQNKLDSLNTPPMQYEGMAKGDFAKSRQKLPAPNTLTLKVGAQVMFLKNDKDKRWVNGTIGIIQKLEISKITVAVGNSIYEVGKETWESIHYEYDEEKEKIVEVVVGSFEQFPLQLAWAITIHKSQGKTFDNVVINLGDGAFAHGQAYVALSRCRSMHGIKLVSPLKRSDVQIDEKVIEFMKSLGSKRVLIQNSSLEAATG